jgi:hypothetical protein
LEAGTPKIFLKKLDYSYHIRPKLAIKVTAIFCCLRK